MSLSARDAVHAAVCRETSAALCSFDRHFDGIAGMTRWEPAGVP